MMYRPWSSVSAEATIVASAVSSSISAPICGVPWLSRTTPEIAALLGAARLEPVHPSTSTVSTRPATARLTAL